jgi:Mn-dependent DtxR family transcriptional regulator
VSYSTEVPDGATQRHSRMMELLTFVNLAEPHGATATQIQAHMLKVFGLKFRTTSEMIRELTFSGALKADGHGFYHLTEKQQTAFKTLVDQEEKEEYVSPLLRRINAIEDKKARQEALKLYEKLLDAIPEILKNQR